MSSAGALRQSVFLYVTRMRSIHGTLRAVTWDCRHVRPRTSVGHVLEFQACQGQNQIPGPGVVRWQNSRMRTRSDASVSGSSVHTDLEIVHGTGDSSRHSVMSLAQHIFKSWKRPAHVNMNARMSVRQARFTTTKWRNDVRSSLTETLFSW